MKKIVLLTLLGLSAVPALAQYGGYANDRQYCASGRSGVDYNTCMYRIQQDRERERDRAERREDRREWERRQEWANQPPPPPPPGYGYQPAQPRYAPQPERKLSDMQQRALDNCNMLAPRDQGRCRATVYSTVR